MPKFAYSVPATERGDVHDALVLAGRDDVDDDLNHAVSRAVQEIGEKLAPRHLVAVDVEGTTGDDGDTIKLTLTATPRA